MSAAHPHNLDLMAPPVTKTIQQRSLIIGVIFSVGAAIGAYYQRDVFIRGYLVSYMDWLGVTLGSMAILMLRAGAW
jgi:multisubunit Na+/H+ antiporter MnhG subunit